MSAAQTEQQLRTILTAGDRLDDITRARMWSRIEDEIATPAPTPSTAGWKRPTALALGAIAAAAAILLVVRSLRTATAPESQLSVAADSTLSTRIGPHARAALVGPARLELLGPPGDATSVRLDRGTLLAEFTGGTGRSLRIEAADLVVEIVGTLFAVEATDGRACVAVAHGTVRVTRGTTVSMVTDRQQLCSGDAEAHGMPDDVGEQLARHERSLQIAASATPDPPPRPDQPPNPTTSLAASTANAPRPTTATIEAPTRSASTPNAKATTSLRPTSTPRPTTSLPPTTVPTPTKPTVDDATPPRNAATAAPASNANANANPDANVPAAPRPTSAPPRPNAPASSRPTATTVTEAPGGPPPSSSSSTSGASRPATTSSTPAIAATASPTADPPNAPSAATASSPAKAPSAEDLYRRAERALAAGDRTGADRALAQLVALGGPLVDQALYERARIAYQGRAWKAARAHLAALAAIAGTPLAEPGRYLDCRIAVESKASDAERCFIAYRTAYPRSPHDLDVLAVLAQLAYARGGCSATRPLREELIARYPRTDHAAAWRSRCPEAP